MKYIFLFLFLFYNGNNALFGQSNTLSLDSCGIDNSILLNEYESRFLNILYQEYRGDFDFTDKRLIMGASYFAKEMQPKNRLFNETIMNDFNKSGKVPFLGNIFVLTGDDYLIANVFDVLIITDEKRHIFDKNAFFCPQDKDEFKEIIISEYAEFFFDINNYSDTLSIDSCGINDNILLNEYESKFLNTLYQDYRGDFDFTNKRVIIGDYWGYLSLFRKVKILPKSTIFNKRFVDRFNSQLYTNHTQRYAPYLGNIIVLSGDDYEITNAFDVLIITSEGKRRLTDTIIYQPPYETPYSEEAKKIIISNYAKLFDE